MATLGTDAARHGAGLKAEFADGVRRYVEGFTKIVPYEGKDQRAHAIAVLSTLIGALTLSRACAGADDVLGNAGVHAELVDGLAGCSLALGLSARRRGVNLPEISPREAASQALAAVARGVFGVPTFFVGGEMFFGKDRLGQVEEAVEAAPAQAS